MADGSKFCTECGKQQASQQAPQQTPLQAPQAVWVFTVTNRYSLFKADTCNIVFMKDCLVLAYLTGERQKAESAKVAADIKAQGLGFFKGSATMMRYWADYSKKYYTMDVNAILAEDPMNQVIPYSMISQIEFVHYESDDDGSSGGTLNLGIINGKPLVFSHNSSGGKQIKEILTSLFGYRLRYK
jgi:hypothetical protein